MAEWREQPPCYPEVGGSIPGAGNLKNCFLDVSSWLFTNADFPGMGLLQKPSGLGHQQFTAQSVVFTWCLGRISTCYVS